MRHSGIPAQSLQAGGAVCHPEAGAHPTFQIKTFSTELQNHVTVMDLVRSNWFPAQRRAKVCLIHRYPGLKTDEQTASRHEIHSRPLTTAVGRCAQTRHEDLPATGSQDTCPDAFHRLQAGTAEWSSGLTQGTPSSPNTKMISPLVEEAKPRGNTLPVAGSLTRYPSGPRSVAHSSSSAIRRAIVCLPGRSQTAGRGLQPQEKQLSSSPQKGFASITITARRVDTPASSMVWESAGESRCPEHRDGETPRGASEARSIEALGPYGAVACTDFSRNSSVMRLPVPEARVGLCGHGEYWTVHGDHREDSFSGDTPQTPVGKEPLVFSSCVHIRVSQKGPNSVYCLDRPLSAFVTQPGTPSPEQHRSVLSLNLSCSSQRVTPDGVGRPAKGGPMSSAPIGGQQSLLWPQRWHSGWQQRLLRENPSSKQGQVGTSTCPWKCCLANTDFAEVQTSPVTGRERGEEQDTRCLASTSAGQLSIHIPGWSYTAGDYTCCDLVVKIKGCSRSKGASRSESSPAPPEPAPPEDPEAPNQPEAPSENQHVATSPLTLQEALRVRRPQFVSRSQERLKKLEHMVQQRKAQRKESPVREQSPHPLPHRKSTIPHPLPHRKFTIPHPLSDNLFKPKERCISEKEMHLRSKRIYNNLPEVKKKKEEQKKRVILQSNRLRAEVFKKQLLDQLLQRTAV